MLNCYVPDKQRNLCGSGEDKVLRGHKKEGEMRDEWRRLGIAVEKGKRERQRERDACWPQMVGDSEIINVQEGMFHLFGVCDTSPHLPWAPV